MTGLLFEHPEWASALLALLALLISANVSAQARSLRRIRLLLGRSGKLRPGAIRQDLLLLGALVAGALALLGPRIGERSVLVSTRGADVVLLLDVSKSMDASDVAPSRIARARQAASELLERLEPEDRAALAAFGGRGVLLTPLTPDTAALREMLPALDTSLIRPAASDLEAGILTALEAFESASDRPRILVVLSDGESANRDTSAASTAALRANTRVLAAALGTETGATIDAQGSELRDSTGHVVVTRRRLDPLSALADRSGGRLFAGDEWGRIDLDELAREVGRDARGRPGDLVERRVAAPMVLPFAAIAFALLLIEMLPPSLFARARRLLPRVLPIAAERRAGASPLRRAATLALIVLLCGSARSGPAAPEVANDEKGQANSSETAQAAVALLEATARSRPLSARELLALGLARARADRWDEAENNFLAAAMIAPDADTAAIAYHDLGVAALRRGELEHARSSFFDSLALRPGDVETRFNLEWTIAALAVQTPEDPPEPLRAPQPGPQEPEHSPDSAPRPSEAESEAELPSVPQPSIQPGEDADEASANAPEPARLSDAQRERWIERIHDDPGKALRSAARGGDEAGRSRRRDAHAW